MSKKQNDFGSGSIPKVILSQSLPLMLAQLVHLLYNVIDRIYIGHLPEIGSLALTGVGLSFPITTLIMAFTSLFAYGGTPIFAIARGQEDTKKAERYLGQVCGMLVYTSVVLFFVAWFWRKPILYLFGASDSSYFYANEYLRYYIFGITGSMLATGLNGFINASGFPRYGMMTIFLGAVLNIVLDPLFIYGLNMGVRGAAIATVISQIASALYALYFFLKADAPYRLRRENMVPDFSCLRQMIPLGVTGFIMQGTSALVQILCNVMLRNYGGDLYVGVITIINSIREIFQLPASAISSASQPVMSFNYGAGKPERIRQSIRFTTLFMGIYTAVALAAVMLFPEFFIAIFTDDASLTAPGAAAIRIYFAGFFFMTFQLGGQAAFTSLKRAPQAIFFSLLRKVIIVVPLTLLLPGLGFGVNGVFLAEPISNIVGGLACFLTMYFTIYKKLPAEAGSLNQTDR
ncbi:MAG: MATE family efflux transporter [Erysipelotrichaceae bacterium]|nr:MATE family efflux transporter [Erysipelotrichaceae bacterium]